MRRFSLLRPDRPRRLRFRERAAQARRAGTTLNLVAYSTPKAVMGKLITRFQHQPAGQGVSFSQSYGPSGSQAKAIAAGQPADIAFLSTGLDIDTIVDAGLVSKNWTKAPQGGIAADSVVAFVVRPGNPKHIHTWKDLTKPGVQVVTPDPFPSGSAKWNVLAAYGQARKAGMSNKKAVQVRDQAVQERRLAALVRLERGERVLLRPGRRPDHLRERGVRRLRRRQEGQARRPQADDADPAADGRDQDAHPAAAKAFIKYVHAPKQQKILAAERLPARHHVRS